MSGQTVISKFGRPCDLARVIDFPYTTVWAWWKKDRIPSKWQDDIMKTARKLGIDLKAEDFFQTSTDPHSKQESLCHHA